MYVGLRLCSHQATDRIHAGFPHLVRHVSCASTPNQKSNMSKPKKAKAVGAPTLKDIQADKAKQKGKYISEASDDGQAFVDLIVLSATHLLENWAIVKKITARDTWHCAGSILALGDSNKLTGRNPKMYKQRSMRECILRIQRWLRSIPVTDEQTADIVESVSSLSQHLEGGLLKWDGDSGATVDEGSLNTRLVGELTDLIPKLNEGDVLVDALGKDLWGKRLHGKLDEEPYPTKYVPYLGEGGAWGRRS